MTQRHLIYHIYPLKTNDVWRRNVRQLKKYWGTFTGRKLIGVATDEHTATMEEVQEAFNLFDVVAHDIEWFPIENDRIKRDGATLEKLLPLLVNEPGITFVAHAKGVSTISSPRGVSRWRNVMYYSLLSDPEQIDALLENVSCVGTHRHIANGQPLDFPDGTKANWHFAGGFWWVDNAKLFARDWQRPLKENNTGWLAETYLPLVFTLNESECLAYDDWKDDIYNPDMYPPMFDDRDPLPVNGFAVDNLPNQLIVTRDSGLRFLTAVGRGAEKLPLADNSLDYVLLDNVLNHIQPYVGLLHEICRVVRMCGAVDIVVPHYGHQLAHASSHVISPLLVEQWCSTDIPNWFKGQPRRLYLEHTDRNPSRYFEQAKKLYQQHTDEQLFAFVPNTCESIRYRFVVGINRECP